MSFIPWPCWKLPQIFNSSNIGLGNAKEQIFQDQLKKQGWIMDQDLLNKELQRNYPNILSSVFFQGTWADQRKK